MNRNVVAVAAAFVGAGCSLLLDTDDLAARAAEGGPADAGAEADVAVALDAGPAGRNDVYFEAVIADQPLAYWPLDELEGTLAHDMTGHGFDARIVAPQGITFGATGAIANAPEARAFDLPVSASLDLGDNFDFPGKVSFTIEAWIRPRPSEKYRSVFDKMFYAATSPENGTWLRIHDPSGAFGIERWLDRVSRQTAVVDTGALPNDRFTHVVASVDGARISLYRDGVEMKSDLLYAAIADTNAVARWGASFDGAMDELAIYDKALSPERIQQHFAAARGR